MKKLFVLVLILLALTAAALAVEPGKVEITAPEGVNLKVYTGFEEGSLIMPSSSKKENGSVIYTYSIANPGNYRWEASGTGFYHVKKNFLVMPDRLAQGISLTADPGKVVPGGFQPTSVSVDRFTDEVMEQLLYTKSDAWKDYEHIFDTPFFTVERGEQQQTTHENMMAYLRAMDDADDHMYLYTLGYSPVFGYEIPIVVFSHTDLSSARTLEEAAALVKENGKATIHYQGLIHANEPSGGEGCLAMIDSLDGDYGEQVLPAVNVYCIPRINADGARLYQRANAADGVDMNRDHLYVQSEEIAMVHHAYNLFMPEVTIDGHEFNTYPKNTSGYLDDVQLGAAGSFNSSAEVNAMAQDVLHQAFADLESVGMRPWHYPATVNNAIGRAYYGLYGSLSFLIETHGIHAGVDFFERRMMCQYVSAESFIDYVVENHDKVVAAVAAGREELVKKGATYEQDDQLALQHAINQSTQTGYQLTRPNWNLSQVSSPNPQRKGTYYIYNEVLSSRTRPTAYVIPKGEAWAEKAVEILTKNGVSHYELEPGSAVLLQQYQGSQNRAVLSEEAVAEFPNGAYVFPMAQVGANVLAMTMEPDVLDSNGYNGTLAQSGVLKAQNGVLPLYRYVRDLTPQGTVELVELPAAPTGFTVVQPAAEAQPGAITGLDKSRTYEICGQDDAAFRALPAGSDRVENLSMGVYYLRFAAQGNALASATARIEILDGFITEYRIFVGGSGAADGNNGRMENAPVATLPEAYRKLNNLMKFAPEGTVGKIVFLGTVTQNGELELPEHSYPVVLEGKTASFGLASNHNITFGGETTLRNMTVTLTKSALFYFSAGGHKMVIEETVTTKPSGSYYYNLSGGRYTGSVKGGADLTVRGGTWRNVYAAGHQNSMSGVSRLTMTGGTVNKLVQSSYSSAIMGDVIMDLSGVKIDGDIYCGNVGSRDINGNVTLILGEGTTAGNVYAGSRDDGDVLGTVEIILAGGSVKGVNAGAAKAENRVEAVYITAASDQLPAVSGNAEYGVDLSRGNAVALENIPNKVTLVRGGGTLKLSGGETLELKKAEGVTVLTFDSEPAVNAAVVTAPASVDAGAFVTEIPGKRLQSREEGNRRVWYLAETVAVTFQNEAENITVTVEKGGPVTAPQAPEREGLVFTGWLLPDGTVWDGGAVTEDLTLKAGWEAAQTQLPDVPGTPETPEAPAEKSGSALVIVLAAAAVLVIAAVAAVILRKKKK